MTEKLKITDFITRFTYYPSLTIADRYRLAYRFDFDFNLPGDWYFRVGFFDNYDSKPPDGLFQERLRLVERVRLQVLKGPGIGRYLRLMDPLRSMLSNRSRERTSGRGGEWIHVS